MDYDQFREQAILNRKWIVFVLTLLAFILVYGFWPWAEHNQAGLNATVRALLEKETLESEDDPGNPDQCTFWWRLGGLICEPKTLDETELRRISCRCASVL